MTVFLGDAKLLCCCVVGVEGSEASKSTVCNTGDETEGKAPNLSALSLGEGGERIRDGSGDIGGLASDSGCTRAVDDALGSSSEGYKVCGGERLAVPPIDAECSIAASALVPLTEAGFGMDLPFSSGRAVPLGEMPSLLASAPVPGIVKVNGGGLLFLSMLPEFP